ncbi:unnamed protein product [Schistosoma mattheei]|uniref:DDRGK domain-containing protein 1 n=1 Tax=Schistosoma mattheei TaxID=31246 RepID=A0AA85C1U5_9TREM|nr:unnamed protein product [Schistosoma mattheei]
MVVFGGLVFAIGILLSGVFIIWKLYNKSVKKGGQRPHVHPAAAGRVRRRIGNVGGQRRLAARMRDASESEEDDRRVRNVMENVDIQPSDTDHPKESSKKVGSKKAAKLAEKERRKEEREAEERYREHQRKIEDMEIEKRKKAEEAEEKAAAAAAAAEAKRREEEAAREQAEYERLKQEFSIEEEGVDVQQQDDKAKAMINAQIIAAIEEAKIIPVEHLAINLNLKTEVLFSSYGISLKSIFFWNRSLSGRNS